MSGMCVRACGGERCSDMCVCTFAQVSRSESQPAEWRHPCCAGVTGQSEVSDCYVCVCCNMGGGMYAML